MAYTGTWRRRAQYTPAAGANPNLGDAVSAADHLTPSEWQNPYAEPTPRLPALPEYIYTHDDYMIPALPVTDPMINEPLGHEYGTVTQGTEQSSAEARDDAYRAHMADFGAAAVHHYADPIERATADQYLTQRIEIPMPSTGSRAALTRGRNAWPENNPDGPPAQGHYVMRWIDRQFTRRGIRTDMQALRPYRAATAAALPAPPEGKGSAYLTPFAALANARSRKASTPQVRRVPRPPDESAISDGTADPQYAAPAYWEF